jgi:glutamate-1-semialdehyde 2,1-aminomutase
VVKYLDQPLYVSHAEGSKIYDLEGRSYIDMCNSFGACLLGHKHPDISEAIRKAAERGILCGAEFPEQTYLAEKLARIVPSAEMSRFTMSGTETTAYAVRLARAFTKRTKVVKFEGHFHGFNDSLQYNHWPREEACYPNLNVESGGSLEVMRDFVIVLPFNEMEVFEKTIRAHHQEIAAVILEPVNYNSGTIEPVDGFLEGIRRLTAEHGIVLIFDEILSGFRTGPDCIQGYYQVTPDLCTLGKALGGGAPLSAIAGKRELMEHLSPLGPAMLSGTYNANLVSIMAGNAFVDHVSNKKEFYPVLLERARKLYQEMNGIFQRKGLPAAVRGLGCRFCILFGPASEKKLRSYKDAVKQDLGLSNRFFKETLNRGVFFHSMWHHGITGSHTDADIAQVLEAVEDSCGQLARRAK